MTKAEAMDAVRQFSDATLARPYGTNDTDRIGRAAGAELDRKIAPYRQTDRVRRALQACVSSGLLWERPLFGIVQDEESARIALVTQCNELLAAIDEEWR